jgi:hypothetical protein
MRVIAAALATLSLGLSTGCGGEAAHEDQGGTATPAPSARTAEEIAGGWTGELSQQGLAPFRVAVVITPQAMGRVAYTGIRCGGTWTFETVQLSDPAHYLFTEKITTGAGGKCKGIGRVTLIPRATEEVDGATRATELDYRFVGGGVISMGVLRPASLDELKPVFKQARAPLP